MDQMSKKFRALRVEQQQAYLRPYDAFMAFSDSAYLVLLESRGDVTNLGRYSFIGADPFLVFRSKRKECWAGAPDDMRKLDGEPFAELAKLLREHKADTTTWSPNLPPFVGGALGYLGYEMLYLIEDIPDLGRDDLALPDSYLIFCDLIVASDQQTKTTWVAATGFGDTISESLDAADNRFTSAVERLERMQRRETVRPAMKELGSASRQRRPRLRDPDLATVGLRPALDHGEYVRMVQTAKDHIFAGDVFEICTTNRFDMNLSFSGFDLYRILSGVNEAPFASYMRFPEVEVVSSSPERFLRLDRDRWAETRPIKGTRPRGQTPEEDKAYQEDLTTCEKDQAENIMIVDLARNDLGRVCKFGTVSVPELRVVESYPFTHQLVSTVRGQLKPEYDAIDLIRATFPGGSMTGAPKVEAMKIIDRLEPVKRGIFSGSIGYFDFDGSFDLNIVIRTLIKKDDLLTFHVGGAIVADSDPEAEYQETLDKAYGMVAALEIAASSRWPK